MSVAHKHHAPNNAPSSNTDLNPLTKVPDSQLDHANKTWQHDYMMWMPLFFLALGIFSIFILRRAIRTPRTHIISFLVSGFLIVVSFGLAFVTLNPFRTSVTKPALITGAALAIGLAIVAKFSSWRRKAPPAAASTILGDARPANRDEMAYAGWITQFNKKRKKYIGKLGVPLGFFWDQHPKKKRRFFFDPEFIKNPDPRGGGATFSHPNCIRYDGQAHMLTVAPARSGKGRDILIPAYLQPNGLGSRVGIDVKGQLAAVCARYSATIGKVFVWNPFNMHPGLLPKSVGINVMGSIDGNSAAAAVETDGLGAAIVTENNGTDGHFPASARMLISGIALKLVKYHPPEERNLSMLRAILAGPPALFNQFIKEGMETGDLLVIERLSRFADLGPDDREAASILSTARTQTAFLSNTAIRDSLTGDEFKPAVLREFPDATILLILPGEYLDTCSKAFRLIVDYILRELLKNIHGNRVTFILDEFASLGHLQSIETAMGLSAGYNIRMWPVLQDINQLKGLYKDTWQTFLANSGMQQWFPPRDMATAQYISERAGKKTIVVNSTSQREISVEEAKRGFTGIGHGTTLQQQPLWMPQDVMNFPESTQFLFMEGVPQPIVGLRAPYWAIEDLAGRFDPDPFHKPAKQTRAQPSASSPKWWSFGSAT